MNYPINLFLCLLRIVRIRPPCIAVYIITFNGRLAVLVILLKQYTDRQRQETLHQKDSKGVQNLYQSIAGSFRFSTFNMYVVWQKIS